MIAEGKKTAMAVAGSAVGAVVTLIFTWGKMEAEIDNSRLSYSELRDEVKQLRSDIRDLGIRIDTVERDLWTKQAKGNQQ